MPTKEEILEHPDIAEFLATHRGASDEIENAARLLDGKSDAILAIKKLLPALTEKKIRIFFSYKYKERKAADSIVALLRQYGGRNLKISYMGDFAGDIVGKNWRNHISSEVRKANWFVLLLPNPGEDWDWCLFETGLFEAQYTSADRLICLHHPDIKLPDPIKDYKDISAVSVDVEKFLHMVFVDDNAVFGLEAISPNIENKIPDIAREIVNAIVPPVKPLHRDIFEPWVELSFPNAKDMTKKEDLDDAQVLSANLSALDLFGFAVPPKTFGDLRSGLPDSSTGDHRWLNELFHVIRRIAGGRKFFPIQAVLQKWNGVMYRPVLCAVDRKYKDGPIKAYHVTFAEEVSHVDDSAIPRHVSELATILRFTFRFRWEVLEKFGRKDLTDEDVIRVENAIKRIRKDWESRGMSADDSFIRLFAPDEAKRIAELLSYWRTKKNEEGTGELDIAIDKGDLQTVSTILKEFIPYNQEFVEMAASRFAELVTDKWE